MNFENLYGAMTRGQETCFTLKLLTKWKACFYIVQWTAVHTWLPILIPSITTRIEWIDNFKNDPNYCWLRHLFLHLPSIVATVFFLLFTVDCKTVIGLTPQLIRSLLFLRFKTGSYIWYKEIWLLQIDDCQREFLQ